MPMDNNRIKPISPSASRLKYETNRNQHKQNKKRQQKEPSQKPSDENNGTVIDDFA